MRVFGFLYNTTEGQPSCARLTLDFDFDHIAALDQHCNEDSSSGRAPGAGCFQAGDAPD
jgi:hypothetical protein